MKQEVWLDVMVSACFSHVMPEIELQESLAGFRKVPKTGVIYVMDEASKAGYCAATAQEWATQLSLANCFSEELLELSVFLLEISCILCQTWQHDLHHPSHGSSSPCNAYEFYQPHVR